MKGSRRVSAVQELHVEAEWPGLEGKVVARQLLRPRKRRTRQHVIADQSVNYVERFIIDAGHTVLRVEKDYGYDLVLYTYDDQGYVEPGLSCLQLKASETLARSATHYVFDLDVRDYNLWMLEPSPVFLVLFDASRRRAYWLDVQRYFEEQLSRRPKKGTKTVRVRIPRRQAVGRRAIARMRDFKLDALQRLRSEGNR
jgi:hypothetical protein